MSLAFFLIDLSKPEGVDGFSFSSGYIEGKAARKGYALKAK